MKEIEIRLLKKLMDCNCPMRASELAVYNNVSISSIKGIVKDANQNLKAYGAKIVGKTGLGNGFVLDIFDQEKFDHYIKEVLPKQIEEEDGLFIKQSSRVNYLMQRLLQKDDYIKADDLAIELNISKNQLSKDLKLVREKFKKVGIEVVNKPYYGLIINADELSVRQCLSAMRLEKIMFQNYATTYSGNEANDVMLAQIKTVIINECERYNYNLIDMVCENLVTHLYIAVKRAAKKYQVEFTEEEKKKIRQEQEFALAKSIIHDIQNILQITLPDNEIYYCAIHLCGKKTVDSGYVVPQEIQTIVREMLLYVDKERGTNFHEDFRLGLNLSLHMVPFISRMEYSLELKNPILEEIKARYLMAYDYASVCAEYLSMKFDKTISENEISYFALHIQLTLDQKRSREKKNVLVVCATGRGSAELLKVKIKRNYGKYFDRIDVCDFINANKIDTSDYHYILSTVRLVDFNRPYLMITNFIDDNDDKNITKLFEDEDGEFYSQFKKELFINNIKAKTKEDAIYQMVENLKLHRDLNEDFYESILEREKLANTCYSKYIAIPHPLKTMSKDTFISVGILDEPVQWDEESKVKVILLCSFAAGFAKNNDDFFRRLSDIISSKSTVRELTMVTSYDDFIGVMKNKLGD